MKTRLVTLSAHQSDLQQHHRPPVVRNVPGQMKSGVVRSKPLLRVITKVAAPLHRTSSSTRARARQPLTHPTGAPR